MTIPESPRVIPPGGGAVRIRPGRRADAAALSDVARTAKALWGYPAEWLRAWRADLTLSAEDVDRMIVRVAEANGEIVGFGAVSRIERGWEVAHLWVLPSHGRRGIGSRLLSSIAREARLQGARRLEIQADPHAVAFYESAGAVRVGTVPAPMPGAGDRVLVVLELDLDR